MSITIQKAVEIAEKITQITNKIKILRDIVNDINVPCRCITFYFSNRTSVEIREEDIEPYENFLHSTINEKIESLQKQLDDLIECK